MVQLEIVLFTLLACISVATLEARQVVVQGVEALGRGQFASAPGAAGNYLPLREIR
jgi:hypothetical protein